MTYPQDAFQPLKPDDGRLMQAFNQTLLEHFYLGLSPCSQFLFRNCYFSLKTNPRGGLDLMIDCPHPLLVDVGISRMKELERQIQPLATCIAQIWIYHCLRGNEYKCYRHVTTWGRSAPADDS
jgi:hypothetical protein